MINQKNVEKLYQLIIKDDERLCGNQWEDLTICGFTNYWLCEDHKGNLLICDANNLKDMYHW